jgi:hypothetical protein
MDSVTTKSEIIFSSVANVMMDTAYFGRSLA